MLGCSLVVEYLPGRKLPSIMETKQNYGGSILDGRTDSWEVSFLNVGYRHTQFLYVGAEDLNSALHTCENMLLPTEPFSQLYRLLWSRRFCPSVYSFLPWFCSNWAPLTSSFTLIEASIWPQGSHSHLHTKGFFAIHTLGFASGPGLCPWMNDKYSSQRSENKGAVWQEALKDPHA